MENFFITSVSNYIRNDPNSYAFIDLLNTNALYFDFISNTYNQAYDLSGVTTFCKFIISISICGLSYLFVDKAIMELFPNKISYLMFMRDLGQISNPLTLFIDHNEKKEIFDYYVANAIAEMLYKDYLNNTLPSEIALYIVKIILIE